MSFEGLVRRHAADLYRYAYWLARDREQAEDVVQEALLRAWHGFPRLRDPRAAKGWMFSIVRNEYYRARGREAPVADVVNLEEVPAPPDTGMATLEMREALMSLPPSYAEPLALQVLGGFTCAEIAEMLGSTEGATMTRLTRARQALRRLVSPASRKGANG